MITFEGPPRQWLKQRRVALGLSQRELAERVNVSPAMIQSLELNRRNAARETWLALARGLEIPPEQREEFLRLMLSDTEERSIQDASSNKLPTDQQMQRLPSADQSNPLSSRNWRGGGVTTARRAAALFGMLLAGFLLATVIWSQNPQGFNPVAAIDGALASLQPQRCDGQSPDDPSVWDAGRSNDSRCVIDGQRITITAGMDTILDASGDRPRTAPLLLRRVRGDFVATVRMEYDGGPQCCRHAGMGLRPPGDESTWIILLAN